MSECIFCKIARKEIESSILYEDEDIIAFKDISPKAPVHVIIIPKKHFSGVTDLKPRRDFKIFAKLFNGVAEVVSRTGISESGFRVVLNQGIDAGQAIKHIHLHVLGGRALAWPPG